jgi:hypothetical protein
LAWVSPNGSVTLRPAKDESANKPHDRNAPGLNHVVFNAESRDDVVMLHKLLLEIGARILDPPAGYPYVPGYYAVYFTDPDGLKFEFVFWPQFLICDQHEREPWASKQLTFDGCHPSKRRHKMTKFRGTPATATLGLCNHQAV